MNFLVFSFGDNDFGYGLYSAVEYAKENNFFERAGEDCKWWKSYVIQFALAYYAMRHFRDEEDLNQIKGYFEQGLTVYASRNWPTHDGTTPLDHDGGSVVFDLNTKLVSLI
jgi:hypothetical protein